MGVPGARTRVGYLEVVAMMLHVVVLIAFAMGDGTATAGLLVLAYVES